ncbi:MAG: lysylphosphatidylglycerol synthase transmembrane domain-containing protein [Planctomycetota bacterium]
MNKHLGLILRLSIAAAGIAFIVYNLNWLDRVDLPPGYVVGPDIEGGPDGASFYVLDKREDALLVGGRADPWAHIPEPVWLAKSATGVEPDQPRFRPSVMTTVRQAKVGLLLLGGLCFAPSFLIGSLRWFMLMRARGMEVAYGRSFRLTMVGVFFNLCFPGATGGDVMKAYYAAKHSNQRGTAVMTVVVDRFCGLLGLVLLVSLLGLTMLDQETPRKITLAMWGLLVGLLVSGYVYTHPHLRRASGFDWLLSKLPGGGLIGGVDRAIVAYRGHKRQIALGVLMSIPIHVCIALSLACAAYAFGVKQPLLFMIGTIPVAALVGALPISGPLGLGAMDVTAVALISDPARATTHQVAMMLVIYRLYAVFYGLLGSLGLMKGDIHLHPPQAQGLDETESGQIV